MPLLRILEEPDKGPFGFGIIPAILDWLEDASKKSGEKRRERRKKLDEKWPREDWPYFLPVP